MSLVSKNDLCSSVNGECLEFGVLLNGIECARRALILHSGGGIQVSGGAIVMVVFCSIYLIWSPGFHVCS